MKKLSWFLLLISLTTLTGCTHTHTFSEATCEQPKTCTECGDEKGKALKHTPEEWEITLEPTCAKEGIKETICSQCGEKITEEIDCIAHTPGEWEIETKPTATSDGVKVQKCTVCDISIQEEEFSLTIGQKNALREAESYLKHMAFSREGLIDQLEYEGYAEDDIIFAVDNVEVNWNEECYEDAQSYLDLMSFSKSGLMDQLEYEGYTYEQIQYAIEKVGY